MTKEDLKNMLAEKCVGELPGWIKEIYWQGRFDGRIEENERWYEELLNKLESPGIRAGEFYNRIKELTGEE